MAGGKTYGKGVSTYRDGGRYDGDWRDSKQHGHGAYVWGDGTRYEGAWRDGTFHGRGVCTIKGRESVCHWQDGRRVTRP